MLECQLNVMPCQSTTSDHGALASRMHKDDHARLQRCETEEIHDSSESIEAREAKYQGLA